MFHESAVKDTRSALNATFSAKATRPIPEKLEPPPEEWAVDFPAMAAFARLSTADYLEAFSVLAAFWSRGSIRQAADA